MRYKILLVEDNEINQAVVLGLLEEAPIDIETADDGLIALETLKNCSETNAFQLILMDCQMPNMDGLEASQAIRAGAAGAQNTNIPIVALTANAMDGDRNKCLDAGMNDYISKPIDIQVLQDKLNRYLNANLQLEF